MIQYKAGNLFDDDAQCFVNAVNCAGVMGAGIAKEFKRRYPDYFKHYQTLCKDGYLCHAGDVAMSAIEGPSDLKIISAATKTHWDGPSTLSSIDTALRWIAHKARIYKLLSIAMPALGCGLGGLKWADVQPLIEKHLSGIDCDVRVYLPREYWSLTNDE
jgi:O-acetyl-ADP-ribose deacetylase (regulator of RNase III)